MTHLFSSLFRYISTLLLANHHYSQHQSLSEHGYSSLLWVAPVREQNDDSKPQQPNVHQLIGGDDCA